MKAVHVLTIFDFSNSHRYCKMMD